MQISQMILASCVGVPQTKLTILEAVCNRLCLALLSDSSAHSSDLYLPLSGGNLELNFTGCYDVDQSNDTRLLCWVTFQFVCTHILLIYQELEPSALHNV